MITFAVISDVHGNSWALRAVLKDIARRQITRIVNLGDTLYGPLGPAGTAEILLEKNMPTVQGNEDRIISKNSHASSLPTLAYVQDKLSEHHYQWLASLPATLCWENTFMCHASPHSDTEYLLWEITASGAALKRTVDVASRLASIDMPLIQKTGRTSMLWKPVLPMPVMPLFRRRSQVGWSKILRCLMLDRRLKPRPFATTALIGPSGCVPDKPFMAKIAHNMLNWA